MHPYVMKISHFCEQARWGLDFKRIHYEVEAWALALNVPPARRIATEMCLPILATGETVVQGSGAVLTWVGIDDGDPSLKQRFEAVTGPLNRKDFDAGTLHVPDSGVREVLLHGISTVHAALERAGWPVIRRMMAMQMSIQPKRLPELEPLIDCELN